MSGRWTRRLRVSLVSMCVPPLLVACAGTSPPGRAGATAGYDVPTRWQTPAPAATDAGWQPARPADADHKGAWWAAFGDDRLDTLEQQALERSQSLRVSVARLDQARAQLDLVDAARSPTVSATGSAARQRTSQNRPLSNYGVPNTSTVQNDVRLGLAVSYEPDLSGRLRLQVAGAQASAEQAAADLESARLLLAAQVATTYFNLIALDSEIAVVDESLGLQQRALDLVHSRHDLGIASGLELAQQEALLDANRTQLELLHNQRDPLDHALATLVGVPASDFTLAPGRLAAQPPALPAGLPSDVLQRRPDIASAQRGVAAANAAVGVAHAAYYPSLLLTPSGGWESNRLSNLISAPSLLWSVGLSATETLFDGGRRRANENVAVAQRDAAVATYRQAVLTALQEVETGLSNAADLARAQVQAQRAIASAQRSLDLATTRYDAGATAFLDVITAQQALLTSQRQATQILGQRLATSVFLVKALGGGW